LKTGKLSGATLTTGSSGPQVVTLQNALNDQGAKIKADGAYGPETKGAVTAYQTKEGLKVDGMAGPETQGALNAQALIKTAQALVAQPASKDPKVESKRAADIKTTLDKATAELSKFRPESGAAKKKMQEQIDKVARAAAPEKAVKPGVEEKAVTPAVAEILARPVGSRSGGNPQKLDAALAASKTSQDLDAVAAFAAKNASTRDRVPEILERQKQLAAATPRDEKALTPVVAEILARSVGPRSGSNLQKLDAALAASKTSQDFDAVAAFAGKNLSTMSRVPEILERQQQLEGALAAPVTPTVEKAVTPAVAKILAGPRSTSQQKLDAALEASTTPQDFAAVREFAAKNPYIKDRVPEIRQREEEALKAVTPAVVDILARAGGPRGSNLRSLDAALAASRTPQDFEAVAEFAAKHASTRDRAPEIGARSAALSLLQQAFDKNVATMTKLTVEAATAPPGRLQDVNQKIQQAAARHKAFQAVGKAKAASPADQAKLDGLATQALAQNVSIEQLNRIATEANAISARAKT
jgi:hypothetical protein